MYLYFIIITQRFDYSIMFVSLNSALTKKKPLQKYMDNKCKQCKKTTDLCTCRVFFKKVEDRDN